jgi:hypothetical protein
VTAEDIKDYETYAEDAQKIDQIIKDRTKRLVNG